MKKSNDKKFPHFMKHSFQKILASVQKFGDKAIVLDSEGNPLYVLMSFQEYEKLMQGKSDIGSLTKEEFLEKINSDIARWKAAQDDEKFQDLEFDLSQAVKNQNRSPSEQEDSVYYFEPIE